MTLTVATRLGPYEILSPLGAGGMGEVYRAADTRLGRTVALKVLPEDFLEGKEGGERKERFEREARTLASLNHANVATLFSFEEISGSSPSSPSFHVLTMELLEGESLREVLARRTPTARQALSWALQAAQGLSAAHAKGIVHRDIKPENLFLTSDGRIKILDFGLAKLTARTPVDRDAATESGLSVPGVIVGTVAYMSPEQIEAEGVDPRSDIFSLGVVLYELLGREHPFRRPTVPATLTAIVNETPLGLSARLPEVLPGADRIVRKCLEKHREERYQSAQELAAVLEAVLESGSSAAALRDVEEKSPYPGLSSFTEEDAGRFFGREEEVAALWRRLHDRNLLAVIGPSGAGKTSFVRAGVVAARPEGWAAIVATPGNAPLRGLARALGPQLASDPEALRRLADFEDGETAFELLSRWRRAHEDVLLVVDQFEELFTLNAPEMQERFAALLGRLANEADVHVLLSLRDDFLMRCHEHETLTRVFEALTPLGPMTREGLRRALVEPAAKRGYRFEDDALVDEMISAVEGARGALPLLAFAVARLWETRDADRKLMSREAYREIGGVAGALARHAETTMDRIGASMEPTVRDIFRNLTTAQGTRAVLDREELISALPDRTAAEAVLGKLIDARLLTSWETEATEGQPAHDRVEIIHESLLSAWPRLVRWQTQDADGAQLRDQLRQAAHLWEERGRAEDLLWTGSTYLDYRAWRGRYPGKLSSLEEDFSESMKAAAERTRRRRRTAVGSVVVALAIGLAIMGVLWNRSQTHAIRAEAAKLLAMAQLEVDTDPAAALAYTTKSIELDDTQTARLLALRITQSAPVASSLPGATNPAFSPDGEWLAALTDKQILLMNQDGREPSKVPRGEAPLRAMTGATVFGPGGKSITLSSTDETLVLSVPDGREIRRVKHSLAANRRWCPHCEAAVRAEGGNALLLRRPRDGGEQTVVGSLGASMTMGHLPPSGDRVAYGLGRSVLARSVTRWAAPPVLLGEHPAEVTQTWPSNDGRYVASVDKAGEIRIWDAVSPTARPVRILEAPAMKGSSGINSVSYSRGGRWLISDTGGEGHAGLRLWDLAAPAAAAPLVLRSSASMFGPTAEDPGDRAFAAHESEGRGLFFWPLPRSLPRVIEWREGRILNVDFTPDGGTLVAATDFGELRAWPLAAGASPAYRALPKMAGLPTVAVSPVRREIAVGSRWGRVQVIPLDGREPRELRGLPSTARFVSVAWSPDGRRVAAAPVVCPAAGKRIHVWDLETGAERVLEPIPNADDRNGGGVQTLSFLDDDRIVAGVMGEGNGLMLFDVRDGKGRLLSPAGNVAFVLGRSRRFGVGAEFETSGVARLLRFDLDGSVSTPLPYRLESGLGWYALDPSETMLAVTGNEGIVRIGPISGGEPHLLLGHKGGVFAVAFSPDGKWLATAGADQTVRLWPVPDVTKVPPHKRSKEEFLATLRTFTNVRAVPDPRAPNGWKLEAGPFPGWRTEPHW